MSTVSPSEFGPKNYQVLKVGHNADDRGPYTKPEKWS